MTAAERRRGGGGARREQAGGTARGGGRDWETGTDIKTLPCVNRQLAGTAVKHGQLSSVFYEDLEVWNGGMLGGSRVGDRCKHIVDSHYCTAETNTML